MRSRGSAARCYTPPPPTPFTTTHTHTLTHPLPISLPGTNARTLHNPGVAHFTSASVSPPYHNCRAVKGHGCHPGTRHNTVASRWYPHGGRQVSVVMRVRAPGGWDVERRLTSLLQMHTRRAGSHRVRVIRGSTSAHRRMNFKKRAPWHGSPPAGGFLRGEEARRGY